jgi:tRNA(Ile)-lysidine synthase
MTVETTNLEQQLLAALQASWPTASWQGLVVVVAVSGGSDSVALVQLLDQLAAAAQSSLVLAHFDHGWRDDSDQDAEFVSQLADQLGWPCVVGHAAADGPQTEQAARDQRYQFLHEVARRHGARCVVTGHTQDDQAETILDRILRGSGMRGLSGIPRLRPLDEDIVLVRPLLACRREELQQYLQQRQQAWREDSSNQDPNFTRNRIRHELLPLLSEQYHEAAAQSLVQLGQLAEETQQYLGQQVAELADAVVRQESNDELQQLLIELPLPAGTAEFLVRELLIDCWTGLGWPRRDMGMQQWKQLAAMLLDEGQPQRQTFPGNVDAQRREKKSGGELLLTRRLDSSAG